MLTPNTIITYILILFAGFSLARLVSKFLKRLLQDLQLPTLATVISNIVEYSFYCVVIIYFLVDLGIQNIIFNLILWFILTLVLINSIMYVYNNTANIFSRPQVSIGKRKLTHVEICLNKHEKVLVPNKIIGSKFPIEKLNPKSLPES